MTICKRKCEVYSRIVGYHRPVSHWNRGKKQEYKDRQEYSESISLKSEHGGKCHQLKVYTKSL